MTDQFVVALGVKLIIGAFTALISILLWSKTRDGAWLLMVIGVVFLYIENLLEVLEAFGFIPYREFISGDVEVLPLIFETLPFIFFTIGMLLFLLRVRK